MTPNYPPVALPKAPFASELQAHCLSFDGAYEDYPWGDVVYKVGAKMFAAIGGDDVLGVTVKAAPEDAEALLALPFVSRARYLGRYGWLTIEVGDESVLDLVRDLVAASYTLVASKRRR
jgi:predicted DNA-binding protein (MmcQ/YjbR family)